MASVDRKSDNGRQMTTSRKVMLAIVIMAAFVIAGILVLNPPGDGSDSRARQGQSLENSRQNE